MKTRIPIPLLFAAIGATLPAIACAHVGQGEHNFVDGFAHPFLGADHLLAMLVVGVWSALFARRLWAAPLAFVSLLALGALLGQHGLGGAGLEALVSASVLVLGVMLTQRRAFGDALALALIGGFGLLHGMAHGGELSVGTGVLAGIVAGSALLHASGMAIAHFALKQRPRLVRHVGQALAVVGGGLVVSALI